MVNSPKSQWSMVNSPKFKSLAIKIAALRVQSPDGARTNLKRGFQILSVESNKRALVNSQKLLDS
jgi:hypothetical protein